MIKKVIPDAEIDDFSDGKYAWEAVQEKTYDLVFTDISMRVMHGPELAERIHSYAPEIPILFMTGESPLRIQEMGIQMERCIFKPVTAAKIREKLNELDSLLPFQIRKPVCGTEHANLSKKREIIEKLKAVAEEKADDLQEKVQQLVEE